MKISQILINHMEQPLGFLLEHLRIEFKVEAEQFENVTKQLVIWTNDFNQPLYQTKSAFDDNAFDVPLELTACTRYFVRITLVSTDGNSVSADSWFETGKMGKKLDAQWIAASDKNWQNTLFKKDFAVDKKVAKARLYMTGLGLYEVYLNQEKVGTEFLAPGVTAYDQLIQLQTYDVTDLLSANKNEVLISTADGWYKGNYGFDGGADNIFGDQQMAIAQLEITYEDGSTSLVATDENWLVAEGKVTHSSIYYGEDLDDTKEISNWQPAVVADKNQDLLSDRLSLPLQINEKLSVKEIITTPAGETVLDFGQNQAGWLEFYNRLPLGKTVKFEFGEILQNGNFFRDNLRVARAAFVYTSDGQEKWVRPHFTYFGYRYVRVTGFDDNRLNPEDFKADVIYSTMRQTGQIKTDNAKVNQLFSNVLWGQKSNFFDVPTDCPQRDERLGWTGDANIFSNTAVYNMDVYAFYKKWFKDIANAQEELDGMVPWYVPTMHTANNAAAVWGDAVTFIPWNMYQFYGDDTLLREVFPQMKAWVEWIGRKTQTKNLWTGQFQFGDWLALDNEIPGSPVGKTEEDFIASCFYYKSTQIVANAASTIGKSEEAIKYQAKAQDILQAIQNEWLTPNGKLALDTQTAYTLALAFKILPEKAENRALEALLKRLKTDNDSLKTGFVGTPYICQVLSEHGHHELASKIFMNEDLPSWLYAVNLGATTVWERWNSVLPDGNINPEGMNSLNHYSIGSIMEWAYRELLGLRQHTPGFKQVRLAPQFDYHLKKVAGSVDTPYGTISVAYQIESDENHTIVLDVQVPFGVTVTLDLPRLNQAQEVLINGLQKVLSEVELTAGNYRISYQPTSDYIKRYTVETPIFEIMQDAELVEQINSIDSVLDYFKANPNDVKGYLGTMSITILNVSMPFINVEPEHLEAINSLLKTTEILSERQRK